MDFQYFCQQYPKETKNIVLEYYGNSINYSDKAKYLPCLYSKKIEKKSIKNKTK